MPLSDEQIDGLVDKYIAGHYGKAPMFSSLVGLRALCRAVEEAVARRDKDGFTASQRALINAEKYDLAMDEVRSLRARLAELEAERDRWEKQAKGMAKVADREKEEAENAKADRDRYREAYLRDVQTVEDALVRANAAEAERDEYRSKFYAVLEQARVWSCEAKTQRATVNEVGAILGGIPDWGKIAAGVEAIKAERDKLRAVEGAARGVVDSHHHELRAALDEVSAHRRKA